MRSGADPRPSNFLPFGLVRKLGVCFDGFLRSIAAADVITLLPNESPLDWLLLIGGETGWTREKKQPAIYSSWRVFGVQVPLSGSPSAIGRNPGEFECCFFLIHLAPDILRVESRFNLNSCTENEISSSAWLNFMEFMPTESDLQNSLQILEGRKKLTSLLPSNDRPEFCTPDPGVPVNDDDDHLSAILKK